MKRLLESKLLLAFNTACILVLVAWLDWLVGSELSLFVLYFVPISIASWSFGVAGAVSSSLTCAAVWAGNDALSGHRHSADAIAVTNTLVRVCAFLAVGWPIQRIRQLLVSEQERTELLRRSLAELKVLEGIMPVCAVCKRIRDDEGQWIQMERYITMHSGAAFSHGYCPACARAVLVEAGLEPHEAE